MEFFFLNFFYFQGGLVEDVVQRLLPLENLKEEILALLPTLMKQEFIILLQVQTLQDFFFLIFKSSTNFSSLSYPQVLVRLHDQGKILNPEQSEPLNPEQTKTLNLEQSETVSTKQSKIVNLEESKILDLEQSESFNPEQKSNSLSTEQSESFDPEQSKTLISEFKSLKIISDCVRILVLSPRMKVKFSSCSYSLFIIQSMSLVLS